MHVKFQRRINRRLMTFGLGALGLAMMLPGPASAGGVLSDLLLAPVVPACISSPFGPRVLPDRPLAGTFHNGIDLPAPEGASVRATAPGEVIRIQRHGPGGLEVLVQHDGFVGVYSHLGHVSPALAEGRRGVVGGQQIGVVGRTGVTYGMHLFFAMIVDGRAVDPAPHLLVGPCGTEDRLQTARLTVDGKLRPTRLFAGP